MKALTDKEEEIMDMIWEKGPLFVREMVELYPEPKPHFNTVSTFVRLLEEKGFLSHHAFGRNYQYYATESKVEFQNRSLGNVISKYFNNSYMSAVSLLVEEEKLSLDDLKALIAKVEQQKDKK